MNKERPILLANDFHIAKDNIEEFRKNWEEMLQVCKEHDVKKVLIGGDLFDSPTVQSLPVMQTVMDMLAKTDDIGINVSISPGNHDKPNRQSADSWVDCLESYADIIKVPHCTQLSDRLYIIQFPYYLEDTELGKQLKHVDELLQERKIEKEDVILYLHAGVHGALGDFDVPNELPQEKLKGYRKVLCAHYHNRTYIKGTEIYYIGASRAHNFGEDEEKGYTLLYPDGTTRFVKNKVNIRYVTEYLNLKDLKSWKNEHNDLYKVRLIISCKSSEVETIDKQALFNKGVNKVELDTEKIQAIKVEQSDISDKFDSSNLKQEYQNFCKEKELDNKMGLRYLNEI